MSKKISEMTEADIKQNIDKALAEADCDAKNWEHAKALAINKFKRTGEITFPELQNFESEVIVSVGLEEKSRISLVVPYTTKSEESDERIPSLKFLDESNKRGAQYDYSKAIKKDFYEASTKLNGICYRVWSEEKIKEPKCRLIGTTVEFRDYKRIGDRASIPTAVPIVIVKEILKPQTQINEILNFCNKINDVESIKENYFGIFRHREFFENMVLAWNLCYPWGYPLHLLWMDVPRQNEDQGGVGRSDLLERVNLVNKNPRDIFDMTAGTSKGLTISFKREIADAGYLLESEIALVDELFAVQDKVQGRENQLSEFYKELNSIMEWRNRVSKSGNTGYVSINPLCRCFFAGNAPRGTTDLTSVCNVVSIPFLERTMPYIVTELHLSELKPNRTKVDSAKDRKEHLKVDVPMDAWLNLVRKTPATLGDMDTQIEKLKKFGFGVRESDRTMARVLDNKRLATVFERRGSHNIKCILEGLCKLNNLKTINQQIKGALETGTEPTEFSLEINATDVEMTEKIITEVLQSWL